MPRPRLTSLLIVGAGLAMAACTTPSAHRQAIEATSAAWYREVLPDDQEELLDHIRELASLGPTSEDWLVSLTLLTRVAFENPSGLVRAEALRAGWALAADLPAEPVPLEGMPLDEYQATVERFGSLDVSAEPADRAELLEVARALASYRFAPHPDPRLRHLPLDLASMAASRACWEDDVALREAFSLAPASARHALSLVTLYAADDVDPAVREESLRAAHHLHDLAALNLITGALTLEDHAQVLLAAVESLDRLSTRVHRRDVLSTLSQVRQGSDLALRQAADVLAQKVSP